MQNRSVFPHWAAPRGQLTVIRAALLWASFFTLSIALADADSLQTEGVDSRGSPDIPNYLVGLPQSAHLEKAAAETAKASLGRRLFSEPLLSVEGKVACITCHVPEQGFTHNFQPTPLGLDGTPLRRNAPTLINVAVSKPLFHDGRARNLEEQVALTLLAPNEMGNTSLVSVSNRLSGYPAYQDLFHEIFGTGPTETAIVESLATWMRTLLAGGSPFDRWMYLDDDAALSASAQRGFALFTGKAKCASCHTIEEHHAKFTDGDFHNTGVGHLATRKWVRQPDRNQATLDFGRMEVTNDPADRWQFRTPTLRNIELTSPYMHNGSFQSLQEVLDFYSQGGSPHYAQDSLIQPLLLDEDEKSDLISFLKALTSPYVERLKRLAMRP